MSFGIKPRVCSLIHPLIVSAAFAGARKSRRPGVDE
jgi:hypothetical protein